MRDTMDPWEIAALAEAGPETLARAAFQAKYLVINEWEEGFVRNVFLWSTRGRDLSPKQIVKLQTILSRSIGA